MSQAAVSHTCAADGCRMREADPQTSKPRKPEMEHGYYNHHSPNVDGATTTACRILSAFSALGQKMILASISKAGHAT